jgi:hypothetical protein
MIPISGDRLPALAPDLGHVLPISGDRLPALASGGGMACRIAVPSPSDTGVLGFVRLVVILCLTPRRGRSALICLSCHDSELLAYLSAAGRMRSSRREDPVDIWSLLLFFTTRCKESSSDCHKETEFGM